MTATINAVLYTPSGNKNIITEKGKTLMEILRDNGFFVESPCGGHGTCGKCAVKASGALSPVTAFEKSKLSPEMLKKGYRLSCLAIAEGEINITLPNSSFAVIETDFVDTFSCTKPETDNRVYLNKDSNLNVGMAVDIGTTTLAARFFNLDTGAVIGTETALNPQSQFGADVISRIDACMHSGTEKLQLSVITAINFMINSFCVSYSLSPDKICKCVFAGNTVMLHIAAGISPAGMAASPFEPDTLFGNSLSAAEIGLNINRDAPIYFSPCISAFVGGDITAGLLACSFDTLQKPALFVDVGTNGEIALLSGNSIFCCSTAAGPAFEGAHIECGIGCIPGAINRVFTRQGKLNFETIDGKKPCGICGSGLIDAAAMLSSNRIFDETGAFDLQNPDVINGKYYFGETEIFISQQDIREIQLAKSAIISGIETLLQIAKIEAGSITNIYIAGGFGSHMDIKSACQLGLLPYVFIDFAKSVGNTALEGASRLLLKADSIDRVKNIINRCKSIDLAQDKFFQQCFIENMLFEPL